MNILDVLEEATHIMMEDTWLLFVTYCARSGLVYLTDESTGDEFQYTFKELQRKDAKFHRVELVADKINW